mmetsp:Transcript_1959/g.1768  ORF Transcript_1959/g.1768 Transcript_1959/m.1768 type:complete len:117 (-) Transcript_1959:41-391(-)
MKRIEVINLCRIARFISRTLRIRVMDLSYRDISVLLHAFSLCSEVYITDSNSMQKEGKPFELEKIRIDPTTRFKIHRLDLNNIDKNKYEEFEKDFLSKNQWLKESMKFHGKYFYKN